MKINELLSQLKNQGYTPYERAIVFTYWSYFSVHYFAAPENLSPLHHERIELSNRIQNLLMRIPSRQWLTDSKGFFQSVAQSIMQTESIPSGKEKVSFIKRCYSEYEGTSKRLGSFTLQDTIAGLSGSLLPWLKEIGENCTEEDFQNFCTQRSPNVDCIGDLQSAHSALSEAVNRAGIPVCAVDALTYQNAQACQRLANSINQVSGVFEDMGLNQFALNRIDLNVVIPFREGHAGLMVAPRHATDKLNRDDPFAMVSNVANEVAQTIIHEYAHSHDFLLGGIIKTNEYLSDQNPKSHPLVACWHAVQQKISRLGETAIGEKCIQEHEIAKRWAHTGIDVNQLQIFVQKWQKSTHTKRDYYFCKNVERLFASTLHQPLAKFYARTILCEYNVLKDPPKQIFQTFLDKFESNWDNVDKQTPLWEKLFSGAVIFSIRKGKSTMDSDRGYFNCVSEQMARNLEMLITTGPLDNYKRTLVYPSSHLVPRIHKIWKGFFSTPHVRGAYEAIRHPTVMKNISKQKTYIKT